MTANQLVAIASRLVAILFFVNAAKAWAVIPSSMSTSDYSVFLHDVFWAGLILTVIALLLWHFPLKIAGGIIPRTRHQNHLAVNEEAIARVGCATIGLWLFVNVAADLLWQAHSALTMTASTSFIRAMTPQERIDLLLLLAEFFLACMLVVGSSYFARLVLRNPDSSVEEHANQRQAEEGNAN